MQWQQLTTLQKALFIIAISLVVPFAPEFIFLADLGGIELVFGFLVLYYQPQLIWLKNKINAGLKTVKLIKQACAHSPLNQSTNFVTLSSCSAIALYITGSMFFSLVLWLPLLLLNSAVV
ncbi:hypothetical protein [Litorilituus sediminis]|uniref:Uncharacterized protein n=1 Tax=Litorilituus sediminis TaxID=718192 RepID=A0A4P6P569_9GAMM|nr:hypothetical protein [Litorilituus sediminis]QBG36108.1 hypothetical protein EMK97_10490 [Litorilituus sediminis]